MTQFFVSDTHFGDAQILSNRMLAPRPFASIEEHDEILIARWNAVVRPEDTVWHLGDFCYRCPETRARTMFRRLLGHRRLVRGNHDRIGSRLPWDGPVVDVIRVVVENADGTTTGVWCSHYAHRVWSRIHYGDLHLFGHSHGSLPSTDVGVDCFDLRPVTLAEIRSRLAENAQAAVGEP